MDAGEVGESVGFQGADIAARHGDVQNRPEIGQWFSVDAAS